jgi:uncharacterized membrane protein
MNNLDRINQLRYQLETLAQKQEGFAKEIRGLREALNALYAAEKMPLLSDEPVVQTEQTEQTTVPPMVQSPVAQPPRVAQPRPQPYEREPSTGFFGIEKEDWERFIGENLINKIGILILIIGVGIGAKYSIEHELISPLTRIIFSYLVAVGLLGFGIKLKEKYEPYSAVLVGGAMAILYFITYIAFSFYALIPQIMAFVMMLLFTVFTVVAAMQYNRQIIAHIGLVGAYAVPFLLSTGSGNVAVLFGYMTIVNLGILFIAFKRDWKPLFYVAFGFTWLIYASFVVDQYKMSQHFYIALTFGFIFFSIFYTVFLAYKFAQKEQFKEGDTAVLLTNSFLFYGLSYGILNENPTGMQLLGLFTLLNAVLHFAVSALIYQRKIADRNVFYLVSGLVLIFITIAIPVQLDGNFVTILWATEAALLFWIGRTKGVKIYENLSMPLMVLAFLGLLYDWAFNGSDVYSNSFIPIFNANFLSAMLFFAAFAFIQYTNTNEKNKADLSENAPENAPENTPINDFFKDIAGYFLPLVLLLVAYFSFNIEISNYFNQLHHLSMVQIKESGAEYNTQIWNDDLPRFKMIWLFNYTFLFLMLLSFFNIKKLKNYHFAYFNIFMNSFLILCFLVLGFLTFGALRESYLSQSQAKYYNITSFNLIIRYISYLFLGGIVYTIYQYIKQDFVQPTLFNLRKAFDIGLHAIILCVLSSELINAMTFVEASQSDKLGLSILWGIYALLLIVLGIWKRRKHLRIAAIALFALTLIKLFLYDIAQMETIAKTIVFVSLGILLLIISFLYNKYKHLIEE